MKFELTGSFKSSELLRKPNRGHTELNYHDGSTESLYWVSALGVYLELSITRGEA